MDDRSQQSLTDYLSGRANGPFGDVEALSGRTLQSFSIAGQRGADNLLAKARRALDDQDVSRARRLIDRAARLPFDEHEGAAPVALAVHMDLFCLVTDTLEQAAAGDSRWLDAALEVLSGADSRAACDLRDVLVAIDHDYSLDSVEHRRIRTAIAAIPGRAELSDLELTAPELCEHVLSILCACRDYRIAVEALDA
ncbi:MAG: hypothetical protein ACR2LF_12365 [Jatrophihabitantaceae bacterium]